MYKNYYYTPINLKPLQKFNRASFLELYYFFRFLEKKIPWELELELDFALCGEFYFIFPEGRLKILFLHILSQRLKYLFYHHKGNLLIYFK